jgi:hypothetical protein
MKTTQDDGWQALFRAAVLEVDPVQLREKIKRAAAAIEQLHKELAAGVHARQEAQQLTDALLTLRLLERTELSDSGAGSPQRGEGRDGVAI